MTLSFENWLSLDLGSPEATLALHRRESGQAPRLLHEVSLGVGHHHSERLIPCLEAALGATSLGVGAIDRYLTSLGPGSFTGLRIAFASLKALAMVSGKPIELVSGSEARALAWLATQPSHRPKILRVVSHVALDKYILARFTVHGPEKVELLEERLTKGEELLSQTVETWLVDAKTPREKVSGAVSLLPLRARHLAEALPHARTRRSLTQLEEWIAAGPLYFGDTKY